MKWLVLMLCCALPLFAAEADMNELIVNLGDQEFDVRDRATRKLSDLTPEYIKIFLDKAKEEKDPEVAYRFRVIAEEIFEKKLLRTYKEYRQMFGCFDCTMDRQFIVKTVEETVDDPTLVERIRRYFRRDYTYAGVTIEWIPDGSTLNGKCQRWDFVESIAGLARIEDSPLADEEYEFTIRRYKDPSKMKTEEGFFDGDNKDYETLKVKVKAGWKPESQISPLDEMKLKQKLWHEYLIQIGVIKE